MRLKKRIVELEAELNKKSPIKGVELQQAKAYEQGRADGYRAGVEYADAEMAKASAVLVGTSPAKSVKRVEVRGKSPPPNMTIPKAASDAL